MKIKIPEILEKNEHGKIEYLKLHHEFIELKEIEPMEQFCFITYCIEYGNFIKLEMDLQAEGLTLKAGNGTIMPNPKYAMKQNSFNSMMKAALHLGLTPKSRLKKAVKVKLSMLDSLREKAKNN
jgi:P27 family predicted phage terminase small subunit